MLSEQGVQRCMRLSAPVLMATSPRDLTRLELKLFMGCSCCIRKYRLFGRGLLYLGIIPLDLLGLFRWYVEVLHIGSNNWLRLVPHSLAGFRTLSLNNLSAAYLFHWGCFIIYVVGLSIGEPLLSKLLATWCLRVNYIILSWRYIANRWH